MRINQFIFIAFLLGCTSFINAQTNNKQLDKIYTISNDIIKLWEPYTTRDSISHEYEVVLTRSSLKQLDKQLKKIYRSMFKFGKKYEAMNDKNKGLFSSEVDLYDNIYDHIGHIDDHIVKVHEYFTELEDNNEYARDRIAWQTSDFLIRLKKITLLIDSYYNN